MGDFYQNKAKEFKESVKWILSRVRVWCISLCPKKKKSNKQRATLRASISLSLFLFVRRILVISRALRHQNTRKRQTASVSLHISSVSEFSCSLATVPKKNIKKITITITVLSDGASAAAFWNSDAVCRQRPRAGGLGMPQSRQNKQDSCSQ